MLLQPTATILDRLQVNQLVAAKQQPMVEAGPGQTAEVSGARDDRKLFVGMLSKGQVRVTIMVVGGMVIIMVEVMMMMVVQVEEDVRQLLASVLGLGGGGVEEVTIYTISSHWSHVHTVRPGDHLTGAGRGEQGVRLREAQQRRGGPGGHQRPARQPDHAGT